MCGFCTEAELKDDCGVDGFGSVSAILDENSLTIPGDITTTETITVGGFREETLETVGDEDWFEISLTEGDSIQIDLFGLDHDAGNGVGEVTDTVVRIYDSSGNLIAENDDISFFNRDSRLTFTADSTDVYYIEVDSYQNSLTGDYRLEVIEVATPPPASPLDGIEGNRSLNDDDTVLVYFSEAGDEYTYSGDTYIATGVNAYEQAQLYSVFEGVEDFADIQFEITTNRAAADLEMGTATLPSSAGGTLLGFFNFPSFTGNGSFGILNNNGSAFPNWNDTPGGTLDVGGFMYGVVIHELGHGLGLGHPHDTGLGTDVMDGVSGSGDRGDFDMNSAAYTAMSYNEGSLIAGVASSIASTGHGATYAALDIAALQNHYGANTTHAGGNDVYDLHDTNATGSGAGYYSTWDTGGNDKIRYFGTRDATIDLRAATLLYEDGGGGFLSYVDGVIGGRTIANGVVIEEALTDAGNDSLTGNDSNNKLISGSGNDTLVGADGSDTLRGKADDDSLDGGAQNDTLHGGSGADTLDGGSGKDVIEYHDSALGVTVSLLTGLGFGGDAQGDEISNVERIRGSANGDDLTGDDNNNTLEGKAGNDTLDGGDGIDRIDGGEGGDTIDGGAGGKDWLEFASASAGVTANLGTGVGTAGDAAGDTYTGLERILGSDFADDLTGDDGTNVLRGGEGDDTINGGSGADTIKGGIGADDLDGGDGSDQLDYRTSDAGVTINLETETASGGHATGDVITDFERVLGSDFADDLTGAGGRNKLYAGDGDDTINGGAGDDVLKGQDDNDTFIFATADGDDNIQGGNGSDIYDFLTFLSTAFSITDLAGADWTITEIASGDVDTVTSVETLRFADIDILA